MRLRLVAYDRAQGIEGLERYAQAQCEKQVHTSLLEELIDDPDFCYDLIDWLIRPVVAEFLDDHYDRSKYERLD